MSATIFSPENSRKITLTFSLVVTLFTGVVGALGADASIRASNANRQSQILATEITQDLQRSGLQGNYEIETMAMFVKISSEELALELSALELAQQGKIAEAEQLMNRAKSLQYQAAVLRQLSSLLNDSRYVIKDSPIPDLERYLSDTAARLGDRVKEQNAASDLYNRYDQKSSNYLSIVTLLSIVLFLLGLAQAVHPRLRIGLAGFSLMFFAGAVLWSVITILN